MSDEIDARNQMTQRHNIAVMADRLWGGDVTDKLTERCHQCGELLHPYPDPKYWMQYPLPTCCILDDLKFCDHYRKSGCIDTYLIEHPTPTGKKKQKKTEKRKENPTEREEIPAKRESATVLVPPGFVFVDVVLPAQKAFIARKWAEQARAKIEAVAKSGKSSAKGKDEGFRVGQRCEIVRVHHPIFAKEIGKQIIITKVSQGSRQNIELIGTGIAL